MDYPAVVFPTGKRVVIDDYTGSTESLPPARNDAERYIREQWDPKTYENAPISLQLVGRRHAEENLVAILDVVEDARREYASRALPVTAATTVPVCVSSSQTQMSPVPVYDFVSTATVSVA